MKKKPAKILQTDTDGSRPQLRLIICTAASKTPSKTTTAPSSQAQLKTNKLCVGLLENLNQLADCIEADIKSLNEL